MSKRSVFEEGVSIIVGNSGLSKKVVSECVSFIESVAGRRAMMEADAGNKDKYAALKEMAFYLISQGDVFNVYHWHTPTNTAHALLDDMYQLCRTTGDKLAETYMVLSGGDCIPDGKRIGLDVDSWEYDHGKVLDRMMDVQETMKNVVKAHDEYSEGVKNIFADFDEAALIITYKYSKFDN